MAPTTNNLKIVYGGGVFIPPKEWSDEELDELFTFLEQQDIKEIDTSEGYGQSEAILGRCKAASRGFLIDTKVSAGLSTTVRATKENVLKAAEESSKKIGTDQFDVYYIHSPDRKVPFKETLEGINELYKAGKFKRFGLSNFKPDEVEDVVRIAKENDFVLPSVYEGLYNAVNRRIELELFPILRKYNIAFYAYSPLAGSFLTKTVDDIVGGRGRFDKSTGFFGQLYNGLYNKPTMLDFLDKFGKLAREENISQAELAYRWVVYNSYLRADKGDAIIIGSRMGTQFTATLEYLKKGPLSQEAVDKLDELWKGVEGEDFLDNFNGFISQHL